jgi:GDP-L-fucose synthase
MNVLVTGGSGFLGKRLAKVEPSWTYLSSKDLDLENYDSCLEFFGDTKPDAIIHLAGRVGGIKDNVEKPAEFYHRNVTMNTNVIHAAYKAEVGRVLSALSTCAFPDRLDRYPFEEEDLHNGPPAPTNLPYGFAKRALHVQSMAYREQYGVNYSSFTLSNLYGPEDNFDPETSHFVPSLLRRISESKEHDTLSLWGSGKPRRQQLYVDDAAKLIPALLEGHNGNIPIIVAPNENLTIRQMAVHALHALGENRDEVFDGKMDGQIRKDGSNKKLLKLIGSFRFTPFIKGVRKTYMWYTKNNEEK